MRRTDGQLVSYSLEAARRTSLSVESDACMTGCESGERDGLISIIIGKSLSKIVISLMRFTLYSVPSLMFV